MSKQQSRNNNNKSTYGKSGSNGKHSRPRREQPRKDSKSKRVNYDNERVSKFERDEKKDLSKMGKGMYVAAQWDNKPGTNDISWYAKNPELLKAAASVPFYSILGHTWPNAKSTEALPGIMAINYSPCVGVSYDTKGPYALNQAGRQMYSYLVHANSRNYNYEYQDLMMMVLAGAQVFSLLGSMIRAYGYTKIYSEQNMYLPHGPITAMGFILEDLRDNLGNMWFDINEMIARVGQIWIPNIMPLIQRWFWLNSNVFRDANDPKGQMYMFNQVLYWVLSETDSTNGTALKPLMLGSSRFTPGYAGGATNATQYTWADWKTAFNTAMNALLASEDRGMIFGDILNAFGADKIYAIAQIPSDYRLEPIFNQEVLTQIENLTLAKGLMQVGVRQHHGANSAAEESTMYPLWDKIANKVMTNCRGVVPDLAVLNFHHPEQPTPEEIAIATRLQAVGSIIKATVPVMDSDGTVGTNTQPVPQSAGSEIVNEVIMYNIDFGNPLEEEIAMLVDVEGTASQSNLVKKTDTYSKISSFDWHPFIYDMNWYDTTNKTTWVVPANRNTPVGEVPRWPAGDYENYTDRKSVV